MRTIAPTPVAALLLTLPAVGCGDSSRPGPAITERDSAGVTIVENGRVSAGATFATVEPSPSLEIGTVDGPPESQLYRVTSGHRLADGRIVIVNAGSHELRFFDAAGQHLRSVGSEGEGPGEFLNLRGSWVVDEDSLFVFDARNRRISVFDLEGTYARSYSLDDDAGFRTPVAMLSDGRALAEIGRVFRSGEERAGVDRTPRSFETYDREGRLLASLGEWPGDEAFVSAEDDFLAVRSLVFGRGLEAVAHGDRVIVGTNDAPDFEILDAAGRRLRLVRVDEPPRPVEPGAFERVRDEAIGESAEASLAAMWRDMFDAMPRHETYPAFESIRTDTGGRIWISDYRAPGEEARWWSVFDARGRALGRVRTPDGLRPLEIGADYLLGVVQDELEVERVRLYGLSVPDRTVEGAATP